MIKRTAASAVGEASGVQNIGNRERWDGLREPLERSLAAFLPQQRWFGGKTRAIQKVAVEDFLPVSLERGTATVILVRVEYSEGPADTYAVPLFEPDSTSRISADAPVLRLAMPGGEERLVTDAFRSDDFLVWLLRAIEGSLHAPGKHGEFYFRPTERLGALRGADALEPARMKAEQSNTSIRYGQALILKFFRRIEAGLHPDFEIGEFLSLRAGFANVPPAAGSIEYRRPGKAAATLGILQGFVPNRGDAWQQALDTLAAFYDRVACASDDRPTPEMANAGLLEAARTPSGDFAAQVLGEYRGRAALLGRRTAELHLALASEPGDPDFAPEPFLAERQRETSEAMIRLGRETFGILRLRSENLPAGMGKWANAALAAEPEILNRFGELGGRRLTGLRIRVHGDLHLGQVLVTGDDFIFVDFEGEPARSLAERRAKHSPLRDVAGMLRSFHYAAYAALFGRVGEAGFAARDFQMLEPWAGAWYQAAGTEFLRAWLETAADAEFMPEGNEELDYLLKLWLLEKAVYELKYELNHRLGWVAIPLEGIRAIIAENGAGQSGKSG
jgi:trehalose synthase-fused probable maltokinase